MGYKYYCPPKSLHSIKVTNVDSIPDNAFKGMQYVENIEIPSNVETIGNYSFYKCNSLNSFDAPCLVTIGEYAFSGCSSITRFNSSNEGELILPMTCEMIGDYAFQKLSLIEKVIIPESVTSIGMGVFKDCNSIIDISLPFVGRSIDQTGYSVFGIVFGWERTSGVVRTKGKTSSEDVTDQGYGGGDGYGFCVPKSVKKVSITVQKNIPKNAFMNCDLLQTITLVKDAVTTNENSFLNCNATVNKTLDHSSQEPWDGVEVANNYAQGNGSKQNPYVIDRVTQLALLANKVNAGNSYNNTYFRLSADLNFHGQSIIIGDSEDHPFSGVFDGDYHTISNISISSENQYVGLFGYCDGTIKNLSLERLEIKALSTSKISYVAPIAYLSENGNVYQTYAKGSITASCSFTVYAGGLIGYSVGNVSCSYSSCEVYATSANYKVFAGGLAAYCTGTLSDSFATGKVSAIGTTQVYSRSGGLVGDKTTEAIISNCYVSSSQIITCYSYGNAYNKDGLPCTISEIIDTLCKKVWGERWDYHYSLPTFNE